MNPIPEEEEGVLFFLYRLYLNISKSTIEDPGREEQ
jgi:hypothetical protein